MATSTSSIVIEEPAKPQYSQLRLLTASGPVYRLVSSSPPRDVGPDEVPIINLTALHSTDKERRKILARQVGDACQNYGFFYTKSHGIATTKIDDARKQALAFFKQPTEMKERVSQNHSKFSNGWSGVGSRRVSPTESADVKEGFIWSYDPAHDPSLRDPTVIPPEVAATLHAEDFIWSGTEHLPGFRDALIEYWQECLKLARALVRIFALALELPETFFDHLVTHPGSDGAVNFYPATLPSSEPPSTIPQVGLGSHTDLQCFTLLWQDSIGGLQILAKDGQWLTVPPIPDTLVVNIGDFLMRLTNDRFVSNVHRVFNRSSMERLSMPFFFGFNFNETVGVLDCCIDENNPARYEPISCGEWCRRRLGMARVAQQP